MAWMFLHFEMSSRCKCMFGKAEVRPWYSSERPSESIPKESKSTRRYILGLQITGQTDDADDCGLYIVRYSLFWWAESDSVRRPAGFTKLNFRPAKLTRWNRIPCAVATKTRGCPFAESIGLTKHPIRNLGYLAINCVTIVPVDVTRQDCKRAYLAANVGMSLAPSEIGNEAWNMKKSISQENINNEGLELKSDIDSYVGNCFQAIWR
jgi:hypothetical protein